MTRLALAALLTLSGALAASAQSPLAADARGAALAAAGGPSLPEGFYLEPVAGGMVAPVDAAFAPDGQLFVVGKFGHVYRVASGEATVILDLQVEVLEHGDRGLLGIELDPGFAQNGWMYLLYTVALDGEDRERYDVWSRLTRYTVDASGAIVSGSRHVIVGQTFADGIPACYASHAPATLAWGRDGTLLVGTGDAASYATTDTGGLYEDCFGPDRTDPATDIGAFRSQSLESLSGKILRLDPATGRGVPSNPFYTGDPDAPASKVWALGFRNPYRFSVDPASGSTNPASGDPGRIVAADVGWSKWEEMEVVARGENAGWPCKEGPHAQKQYAATPRGQATCDALVGEPLAPTLWWHHSNANRSRPKGRTASSVVAGPVYRGSGYPEAYYGRVFYVDYAEGWMATAEVRNNGRLRRDELFASGVGPVVDIAADPVSDDLHFVNVWTGQVSRLRYASGANNAPVASAQAAPGDTPREVQFIGSGSFDPDGDALTYAWDFGDGETSDQPDPAHTYAAAGTYTAHLTVTDPSAASGAASVAVTVDAGTAPEARITRPGAGDAVAAGQTVTLEAAATDPDGPDDELQYDWRITLVHNGHQHPGAFGGTGQTTDFAVPFHGASGEVYALRVQLAVTDRDGDRTDVERLVRITTPGETDVTLNGTPVALVMAPTGGGSRDIEILRDGTRPAPVVGVAEPSLQYDTYNGGDVREVDWIGYTFDEPRVFSRVTFQEGIHFDTGGWFNDLRVQVRQGGTWQDVGHTTSIPAYRGDDRQHFDTYELVFAQASGDGIRIAGAPGGLQRFVSAAELRAWAVPETSSPLPEGWAATDVGAVGAAGSTSASGGDWTLAGGGNLWGDTDAFHFAHTALSGDGTITAHLDGLAGASPKAKAGLMIRDGLGAAAPYVGLLGTPARGLHLHSRAASGAGTDWTAGPDQPLPTWLRLERLGDLFTASVSEDGTTWTLLAETTVIMGPDVRIGLFATSTDTNGRLDLATASFSSVALAPEAGFAAPEANALIAPSFVIETVFPNPVRTSATVRLGIETPGLYRVALYDALGRQVAEASVREDAPAMRDVPLALAGSAPGIYVLRVTRDDGGAVTRRITVVR